MSGDYSRFTHQRSKRFSGVRMQQGRVQLDADWNEQGDIDERRWRLQANDTFGHAAVPKQTTPNAFRLQLDGNGKIVKVQPGRMYVDGLVAERFPEDDPVQHSSLPLSPEPPPLTQPAIVYLDVWEREVTYVEDPDLLEPALGGPDTCARTQVVWQIKVQPVDAPACGLDLGAMFPLSAGRLSSRAVVPPASADPCVLPPTGNYRGLENRLYRVEIHDGGPAGTATFKWSRENASIVSRVTQIDGPGKKLTVTRIGRDKVLRFQNGDWVEVTDDVRELKGEPGVMARVVGQPDEAALTMAISEDLSTAGFNPADPARHTRVRLWNQRQDAVGNPLATGLLPTGGGWIALEDGIEVEVKVKPNAPGGAFHTGDYWVFAARAVDGSVETLTEAPPRGIHHHYAQLAAWTGSALHDCRRIWPGDCCCCTIEVGDGKTTHGQYDDVAEALEAAVHQFPDKPIRICLLPGDHTFEKTVVIQRPAVTISGCCRQTRVSCRENNHIFEVRGDLVRIECLDLLPDGTGSGPLVGLTDCQDAVIENNRFENPYGTMLSCERTVNPKIVGNRFRGREGILAHGTDVLIAGNELVGRSAREEVPQRGLIDLRSGTTRAWVIENRLKSGFGHGITLSDTDVEGRTAGPLYEIVIAANEIRDMHGSGIATTRFRGIFAAVSPSFPLGNTPIFIHELRIEHNTIWSCAPLNTWRRDDGVPQGGIVLGGVARLAIADNRIVSNGADPLMAIEVAGIYVGHCQGLIVRDNLLLDNGPELTQGRAAPRIQGGIVALDLSVTSAMIGGVFPSINTGVADPQRLVTFSDSTLRTWFDGWPAAAVHGNLVVAPLGRALTLLGRGPMMVTDNRLIAREASAETAVAENSGRAVLIHSTSSASVQTINLRLIQPDVASTPDVGPILQWSQPALGSLDSCVLFADNQVQIDSVLGSERTVVQIASDDDVAFHDNQVRCLAGTPNLWVNTILYGNTVRATGNGIFEPLLGRRFTTLLVQGSAMSSGCDNQTTHCIQVTGGRTLNNDNLMLDCKDTNTTLDLQPFLTHFEIDRQSILSRLTSVGVTEVTPVTQVPANPGAVQAAPAAAAAAAAEPEKRPRGSQKRKKPAGSSRKSQ
jgi:uncharacterized protein DUF6519